MSLALECSYDGQYLRFRGGYLSSALFPSVGGGCEIAIDLLLDYSIYSRW